MTDLYRDLTPEKFKTVLIFNANGKRGNKYAPHQGEREKARRVRQAAKRSEA